MKRLTKLCEDTNGGKYMKYTAGDYIGVYPNCTLGDVIDRLAHYENLEEQGRMVELPEIEIEDCTRCWYCAPHGGCSIHNTVPGGCKDFASKAKRGTALAASGKEVRYE